MVDPVEEARDVGLRHPPMPGREVGPDGLQRGGRRAPRPEAIRDRQEVGLEDRLQDESRRLLGHPVADRRDAQGSYAAVWFGDRPPPHRRRTIAACPEVPGKLVEQALDAIGLDIGQGQSIDPRRASVGPDPPPRLAQDVSPEDAVIEGVEAPFRGLLGRSPELALELLHFAHRREPVKLDGRPPAGVIGPGGPGHALVRTSAVSVTKVGALPSRRVVFHADRRYYDPVGLPLPSARFHHRLIRAVFARRRLGRRVSPVPDQTMRTCRSPYPGGTR
jgi:hypothetical protein